MDDEKRRVDRDGHENRIQQKQNWRARSGHATGIFRFFFSATFSISTFFRHLFFVVAAPDVPMIAIFWRQNILRHTLANVIVCVTKIIVTPVTNMRACCQKAQRQKKCPKKEKKKKKMFPTTKITPKLKGYKLLLIIHHVVL